MMVVLSTLDIGVFLATLAISVIIGVYFANKTGNLDEYMLGGRDQRLLPVSLSMMTSFISGLTLVGVPAELYHHGWNFTFTILGSMCAVPLSAFLLLPIFHQLETISIFSYLELRYSAAVRRIVSLVFMFQMTLYNAVVLYVPSLSLQSVLGISDVISIGVVGLACLVYSTLGGIKAVIWTDFFQASLMYLSLISICIGGTLEVGGLSKVIELNTLGGRFSMENFFNLDLRTRHTLFTILLGSTLINVFMNGANQIQVQRSLSLPSLRMAQWSMLIASLFTSLISVIASYIGLLLTGIYGECDPFENGEIDKRDAILIHYVATHLAYLPGLRGLFVAGIFAATLSTLSSFQNSMSAIMLDDFITPLAGDSLSDKQITWLGKLIALFFGLACIGLTFVVGRITGLLQVAYTLFGALGAPLIAAFFMGILTRFANTTGTLVGMLIGFASGVGLEIYQTFYLPPLQPSMGLSMLACPSLLAANSSSLTSLLGAAGLISHSVVADGFLRDFLGMSYLWLPVFALVLTVCIITVVSLLTGGLGQEVDDRLLAGFLKRKEFRQEFEHNRYTLS